MNHYLKKKKFFWLALLISFGMVACHSKPFYVDLLSSDPVIRTKAVEKLEKMRLKKREKLIPALVQSLQNNDPQVVQRSVDALIIVGAAATQALGQSLKDPTVFVR